MRSDWRLGLRLLAGPVDGFETGPCLRFPRQARFHPLKYLAGLCGAIERMGGRIFCGNRDHGSRFDPYGKVIMGPSVTDLKSLDA